MVCIKDQIKNLNIVIGCNVGCPYCYARINTRRFHITDDFEKPVFFPEKLKIMDRAKPQVYFLTGMNDFSVWQEEWKAEVLKKIEQNPQHQFIILTKRPDIIFLETDLDNAWFGVTVTRKTELWRIDALRSNIKAKHYHITFEPLFDDLGEVDFSGIEWIVVGTMTGAKRNRFPTEPSWANSLTEQAHALQIPVFWKEDLAPIMGEDRMIQEMPEAFNRVLKEQSQWGCKTSK